MTYRKGDKVVYPHHGAAIIQEIGHQDLDGKKTKYLTLRLAYGDLTLKVPVANTAEVGIRDVVSKQEVKKVFKVLQDKASPPSAIWSHRFKSNAEKLRSNDIFRVAEVVRDLSVRNMAKELSAGEKRMLTVARQILISELTFAVDASEDEAGAMVDKVLDQAHA